MKLELVDTFIRWLGGLLAYSTLGILFYGIWRGTRRKAGLTTGRTGTWLRSLWFYLASALLFFGLCYFGWIPLPLKISSFTRAWLLTLGSLLYFPGMLFALWGRLALGKNYFVSTGFGAQLFVRHPMYTGIFLAALGSLLLYPTWTTLLFACFAPLTSVRAHREEAALAAEFGEQWQAYCRRVPAFFPRLNHKEN
jgi:protein-S-isoprenylcysteine O-methyltransferase Ste14